MTLRPINCRGFDRQVADWLGGRLPPERGLLMAAHREQCAACARLARSEERLRESWREAPAPAPDVWPRLALRLEPSAAQARRAWRPRGWALNGAALLIAVGVYCLCPRPIGVMSPASRGVSVGLAPAPPVSPQSSDTAHFIGWSPTADVSQEDASVDDPAGTAMENVWTQLKTSGGVSIDGQ